MAGYQVYLPGQRGADPELLRAVGLGDILDENQGVDASPIDSKGPDGGGGVIFFFGDTIPGYRAGSQIWQPAKPAKDLAAGRFWLGIEANQRPTPSDLQRHVHFGGALVKLDDGNEWMVPIAQRLPHRLSIDENGNPVRVPKRKYEEFYRRTVGYYQSIVSFGNQSEQSVTFADAWPHAVEALTMNYRVNADVIDFLELLDDVNVITVVCATFEMGVLMEIEAQKKTA